MKQQVLVRFEPAGEIEPMTSELRGNVQNMEPPPPPWSDIFGRLKVAGLNHNHFYSVSLNEVIRVLQLVLKNLTQPHFKEDFSS